MVVARRKGGGLTVVLLVVLDVVLRLAFGFGNPLLYQNDPDAGYVVLASQHVTRLGAHNDINSFSMRSPDVLSPKPAGEFRLLILGDSITYGTTYVDQDDIFTSRLARDLPSRLRKTVEVLNASAGGWAPANELGYLRSRGTFGADVVMFVWNTGDLIQPMSLLPETEMPAFPRKPPLCALSEVFYRFVLPRLRSQSVADPGSQPEVPNIAAETPANLAMLDQAKSIASASGAKFAVVYVAGRGPEWAAYAPGAQLLKEWCHSTQTPLVDVTASLSTLPAEQTAFENGHGHLRPAGHALVASAISEFLSTDPFHFPAPDQPDPPVKHSTRTRKPL